MSSKKILTQKMNIILVGHARGRLYNAIWLKGGGRKDVYVQIFPTDLLRIHDCLLTTANCFKDNQSGKTKYMKTTPSQLTVLGMALSMVFEERTPNKALCVV